MNWDQLFSMQETLDQYIIDNHDLSERNVFEEKFLALLVELGELANETRCFKFWSTKERNDTSLILEEYVDNIHFLLSIGLEKEYVFSRAEIEPTERSETEQFNDVFKLSMRFYNDQSEENYHALFKAYLQLASLLGFTEKDIQHAYHEKNEVNFARQDAGY